jgi:hypothetical protein
VTAVTAPAAKRAAEIRRIADGTLKSTKLVGADEASLHAIRVFCTGLSRWSLSKIYNLLGLFQGPQQREAQRLVHEALGEGFRQQRIGRRRSCHHLVSMDQISAPSTGVQDDRADWRPARQFPYRGIMVRLQISADASSAIVTTLPGNVNVENKRARNGVCMLARPLCHRQAADSSGRRNGTFCSMPGIGQGLRLGSPTRGSFVVAR